MATLPAGGVILCGHSMGGLLTAEVAFAAPPGRVIGLISFDVPYLGVHPRVILSGIASLFKKRAAQTDNQSINSIGRAASTDHSKNLHLLAVNQLPKSPSSGAITTDTPPLGPPSVQTLRSDLHANPSSETPPTSSHPPSLHLSVPLPPIRVMAPRVERLFQTFGRGPIPQSVHNLIHFFDKHPGLRGIKDGITQIFEFGGCLLDPRGLIARYERMQRWGSDQTAGPYGRGWVNLWTTPVSRSETGGTIHATTSSHSRYRAPTQALSVLSGPETSQFHTEPRGHPASTYSTTSSECSLYTSSAGLSLFQSSQLDLSPSTTLTSFESTRYDFIRQMRTEVALNDLQGQPSAGNPSGAEREEHQSQTSIIIAEKQTINKHSNTVSSVEMRQRKEAKKQEKLAEKERRRFLKGAAKRAQSKSQEFSSKPFIVLPRSGTDHQWVRTPVVGAEDEIVAHCGLFTRDGNPGYNQLIEDVGDIVRSFWDGEGGLRHSRENM